VDAAFAERIGGYHLTALGLMTAAPAPTPDGRACSLPRSSSSSARGWPDPAGSCRTAECTSCSRNRSSSARTTWPPCPKTGSSPTRTECPCQPAGPGTGGHGLSEHFPGQPGHPAISDRGGTGQRPRHTTTLLRPSRASRPANHARGRYALHRGGEPPPSRPRRS
jgi:hypothetical protein